MKHTNRTRKDKINQRLDNDIKKEKVKDKVRGPSSNLATNRLDAQNKHSSPDKIGCLQLPSLRIAEN